MPKARKPLVVTAAMLILVFALASCATEKPKLPTTDVPGTTQGTQPSATDTKPAQQPTGQDSTATTPTSGQTPTDQAASAKAPAPEVSEVELRNLYGSANALRLEAQRFELESIVADYRAVDDSFLALEKIYSDELGAIPYDGARAFPLKKGFEDSIAAWEKVLGQGMPVKADAEREKAVDKKFAALGSQAPDLAASRYAGAQELLDQADGYAATGDTAGYSQAMEIYKHAAVAFDVANEKAKAEAYRNKVFENGYARYADSYFVMAETKYAEEDALWAAGSQADMEAGAAALKEANSYYDFVVSKGAEYKSFEGKDAAMAAKKEALSVKADANAPEAFANAELVLAEATVNQEQGNYEGAYAWFVDAASAYGTAYEETLGLKAANEEALAAAGQAVSASQEKADANDMGDNVYLAEAKAYLAKAEAQGKAMAFGDSTVNANEAVNYSRLSDNAVDAEVAKAAKAEAERLAAEKALADPAMDEARTRMAWAENNNLSKDYPAVYKASKAAMEAAEKAYAIEEYPAAKYLAGEVTSGLSDEFQSKVLSERKIMEAEKVRREELAAAKASADAEMAKAQSNMAWANEIGLKADYPDEYKTASSAMVGSFVAYGTEDYAAAEAKAKVVNETLSQEFQAGVNEERAAAKAAAEKLAADKALADPAMDEARTRMAWAENNGISKDYPKDYKTAHSAMEAAEKAYAIEAYGPAKTLADDVNFTLSDGFQKKVLAVRQSAEEERLAAEAAKAEEERLAKEEAERLAAEKSLADPAMGDARTRMAWAENNNLAKDHAKEYKSAHAAMEAAEKAYSIEAYVPAKTLAEEVSATLSDDFQKSVLAHRAEAERLEAQKAEALAADAAAKAAAAEAAAKAKAAEEAAAKASAEKAAARSAAEADMASAQARMAWANEMGIKAEYPEEFGVASTAMRDAFVAFGTEDFAKASEKAGVVNSTLSDDFQAMVNADREAAAKAEAEKAAAKAAADPALDDARTRMAWAENNDLAKDHAKEYKSAHAAMEAAEKAYGIEAYAASKTLAEEVSATLSDDFQKSVLAHRAEAEKLAAEKAAEAAAAEAAAKAKAAEEAAAKAAAEKAAAKAVAEADLKAAQDKYEWAKKVNGVNNYPSAMGTASSKLSVAGAMYAAGDYANTSKKSKEAVAALDGVKEFAPLPAQYVVRLIPQRRDCLWRIAEYPFIYNNPLKWPVLYEANKKTFRDPSNPDLIYPGQVLVVPSIKGESREGTWDPRKTYQPLAK